MNEKSNGVTLSGVWKVAAFLLSYLVMGVWITARISAGNEGLILQMQEMKKDVRHLSVRLDSHIDQHVLKGNETNGD